MGSSQPPQGLAPEHQPAARSRAVLGLPYRVTLMLLLLAALVWMWFPMRAPAQVVVTAQRYLATEYADYWFEQPQSATWFLGTWTVAFATDHQGEPAKVAVEVVRRDGELAVASSSLSIGRADGGRLLRWGLSVLLLVGFIYLVFFVSIPRTFGRKCPRDLSLLAMTETTVVAGQSHASGVGFAPIIERIYACRVCDFEHHEALVDPTYRMWATLPHWSSQATNEWRLRHSITKEQYERLLTNAKDAARAKCSSDSPWLYR